MTQPMHNIQTFQMKTFGKAQLVLYSRETVTSAQSVVKAAYCTVDHDPLPALLTRLSLLAAETVSAVLR